MGYPDNKPKVEKTTRYNLRVSVNEVEITVPETGETRERRVKEVTNLSQSGVDLATLLEFAKDHLHLVQGWIDKEGNVK